MKKLIFLFIFFSSFAKASVVDTIDFCHVYFGKEKILEINQNDFKSAKLELKTIKATDTLRLYYFTDTPSNTMRKFEIHDGNEKALISRAAKNDNKSFIIIYGSDLILLKKMTVYCVHPSLKELYRVLSIEIKK